MTEPKDFHSIDDLFKNTLDGMPDVSGASGWDVPSDRVWHAVQSQLPGVSPASNLWVKGLALAAVLTVAVVAVVFFRPSGKAVSPETKPAIELPKPPATEVSDPATAEKTETALPENPKPAKPNARPASKPSAPAEIGPGKTPGKNTTENSAAPVPETRNSDTPRTQKPKPAPPRNHEEAGKPKPENGGGNR